MSEKSENKAQKKAQKWLQDNHERWMGAVCTNYRDALPFVAGLHKLIAMGCVLKARHDALSATPEKTVHRNDISLLEDWGWHWNEEDETFVSFYPGG